jgi:hypothetical protein
MTSSEERKCKKCEFSAPVSDWKVFPEYHPFNVLCYECREMSCKVCKYSGRVRTWRYEGGGVTGKRCPLCADPTLRKCTRCEFTEPLANWKIKKDGVPGKYCEYCCAAQQRRQNAKDEEEKAFDNERSRLRNGVMVKCSKCNREVQVSYLKKHLKSKRCIDTPVDVPLLESTDHSC